MTLVLNAACGSSIGKARTNNEDNCFFRGKTLPEVNTGITTPWYHRFNDEAVCFGVFDGMDGEDDVLMLRIAEPIASEAGCLCAAYVFAIYTHRYT